MHDFLGRPIEGDWPYLWLDATYVKVREAGRIVSVAVTIAVGVNADGRREVLGMAIGASEAEPFWLDFLRSLARRGLAGARLVISDAHESLKAAVAKVLRATWQMQGSLRPQRPGPCEQDPTPHRLRLDRHRLRRGRRGGSEAAVAHRRRPAPPKGAQARDADGQRRGGRPRLHDVPRRTPGETALDG